ncbi:MAG: septum site-determining protein MinC [Lachnospiraceae bacterium]|nr:septum site-determining protein MinC [Lachnospiraceae bacterium]
MSQAVIIKNNKYGIQLFLDADMPFEDLLRAIIKKFEDSAKFFRDAKVAVSFEGRELTAEESYRIVEAITSHTEITIICIVDNEQSHAELFKQQIDTYYDSIADKEGEFYRGNLRSGQVLENVSSIVIVGDVNAGARIISQGNIIVLGTLQGNAYAGAAGNQNCFIAALEMSPAQLQIGDVAAKIPEKKTRLRRIRHKEKTPVAAEPQIAVVKGEDIYIEPITKGILA